MAIDYINDLHKAIVALLIRQTFPHSFSNSLQTEIYLIIFVVQQVGDDLLCKIMFFRFLREFGRWLQFRIQFMYGWLHLFTDSNSFTIPTSLLRLQFCSLSLVCCCTLNTKHSIVFQVVFLENVKWSYYI